MTKRKTIILAGGTGFIGEALEARLLASNYDVVVLSRNPDKHRGSGRCLKWDGRTAETHWSKELDGAEAIINLAGKNVNCRPSQKNRNLILDSRVDSVNALGAAVRQVATPPKLWIQASSLAIYGDRNDDILDEAARVAKGFPADVCVEWESALGEAILPQMRWLSLRIGFVLGKEDGALPFLAKLTKVGLGGSIGSGNQYISWIHEEDLLSIFDLALENPTAEGIYHVCTETPLPNREFMKTLRQVLTRPWSPPAPALAVKIGAPLLNSDPQIALSGRRCIPAKLIREGFRFEFPDLKTALTNLYHN